MSSGFTGVQYHGPERCTHGRIADTCPKHPTEAQRTARTVAEAIEAEREGAAKYIEALPADMRMSPAEVAAILRQRPRP